MEMKPLKLLSKKKDSKTEIETKAKAAKLEKKAKEGTEIANYRVEINVSWIQQRSYLVIVKMLRCTRKLSRRKVLKQLRCLRKPKRKEKN